MIIIFAVLSILSLSSALDNGVGRTPPMGWLSWERFTCNIDCKTYPKNCINEQLYKDMADRLVEEGYLALGYEYVNIDDCWLDSKRDSEGKLVPDPDRFPSGIKALADYMHSKGLKLGIYQDCGTKTCAGYPGSGGYFDIDAQTFADWEVDMLKLDGCYADPKEMDNIYPQVTAALNKTERPILFSCSWPAYQVGEGMKPDYQKIAENCNIWRNYGDIDDSWGSVTSIIDFYAKNIDDLVAAAGPGHFNDPDMLVIGNFGLSFDQAKAQMALWSVMAAPLLMSNDLRNLKPEFKEILQNKYAIAVNQDKLGLMGKRIFNSQNIEIWTRPITPIAKDSSYSYAVVVFNRNTIGDTTLVTAQLDSIGLTHAGGYDIINAFEKGEYMGYFGSGDKISVMVNPSGVVMLVAAVRD